MARQQLTLPLGPIRNNHLFSNHWLENRLLLEPEWTERREEAKGVLERLAELWKIQHDRVAQYGNEQSLEQAFIQPVLQTLGWHLKYQTFLRGRKPDYALYLDDESLRLSLRVNRKSADFWKYPRLLADRPDGSVSPGRRSPAPPELHRPTLLHNGRLGSRRGSWP